MDTNQTTEVKGFSIESGNGIGTTIPAGFRMVKVAASPEKGKRGKGKVFAFSLIPTPLALTVADFDAVKSMVHSLCVELQKDIICRVAKAGGKAVTETDISVAACAAEYAARTFTVESISDWFEENMQESLAFDYCTHKGYDAAALTAEQTKEVEQVCNVWRDSYAELGKRSPVIASDSRPLLLAKIAKYELDDAIATRIVKELTPTVTASALGTF